MAAGEVKSAWAAGDLSAAGATWCRAIVAVAGGGETPRFARVGPFGAQDFSRGHAGRLITAVPSSVSCNPCTRGLMSIMAMDTI